MKGIISKVKDKGSAIQQKLSNKPAVLSVDSATETPEMKDATRHVEQTYTCLSNTKRSYDKFQKMDTLATRDHRAASDTLKEYSTIVKSSADFAVLGEFVDQVVGFSEQLQALSKQLNSDMCAQLLTPLEGILEGDLAEAEFSKKRFNKVLSDYDAVSKRIQQMNAKGQPNPQRLHELEKEQEMLQSKFDTVGQQTMQTLTDVNHRVEFAMFQTLSQYVETYHLYFSRGSALIEEVSHNIGQYRLFSEKKREVLESGGSADQVRFEDMAAADEGSAARDPLERSVLDMLEKERSYVRKLDTISKSYIQNIRVDDVLASKFSDEDHRLIFSNVEELLSIHKSLVVDLENDLGFHPTYNTGRILSGYVPRFRAYVSYVRNYSSALNALDQLEQRSQSVKKFMRTMDRKNGLRGLLCEPTSRISHYVLGLNQILRHTPAASEERNEIAAVIADLTKLVEELQEAQQVSNNIGTMLPVHNELAGFPGKLLEPSRVLRKETMLEHHFTTPEGKAKTELHKFYLCTDILIQAKKRSMLASPKANEAHKKMVYVTHLPLEGACVDRLPDNEETGLTNGLEIRTGGQALGGLVVGCASPEDAADVMNLINELIVGSVTNAVFEVPLTTVMENQRDQSLDVPEVVQVTSKYLLRFGLEAEGIFRMSGAKREVMGIVAKFNRGENVVLENETSDEHTVAGVLKHWVRYLPEPLLTYALTEGFLTSECDAATLRGLLSQLPALNFRTTRLLFSLLNQVTMHSDVNKMDSKNLAIVFAPGLLRPEGASDFDTSHYEQAYAVIGYMVDYFEDLFEGAPATAAPVPRKPSSGSFSRSPSGRVGSPTPPSKAAPKKNAAFAKELNAQIGGGRPVPPKAAANPSSPAPRAPHPSAPKGLKKGRAGPKKVAGSPKAPDFQAPVKTAPVARRGSVSKMSRRGSDAAIRPGSPAAISSPEADPTASPSARPLCARCREPIRGSGLKALGVAWHKDCFVCTHCEQPFAGGKILQKEGKPYCEPDYRKLFGGSQAKICRACNTKISGPFMKALNGFWHADHFMCHGCGGSVAEGYYEKDEFPWCANCFTE